jgi:hypothetical protein
MKIIELKTFDRIEKCLSRNGGTGIVGFNKISLGLIIVAL